MIRLSYMLSLIFFVFMFVACKQKGSNDIAIVWNNDRAAGLSIPKSMFTHQPDDSILKYIIIRLKNNPSVMLGDYTITDTKVIFKPLVPLSPGLSYSIYFRNNIVGSLSIPLANSAHATSLVAIYPTSDTVPENLLKTYLQFSSPMREGEALDHISLLDERNDTVPRVFLNLQPELWNEDRTILTIWLDPGRIKRDLIPNMQMGNPLRKGKQYTLSISNEWKDIHGLQLRKSFNKKFIVAQRDSISPQPELWKLIVPAAATTQPLIVTFGEPLDYFLLQETIAITDDKGHNIPGELNVVNKEGGFIFSPAKPWQAGHYRLVIESKLEDLAGNNLNSPFDRDTLTQPSKVNKPFAEISFIVGGN